MTEKKEAPTRATYVRTASTGGLAFLGPLVMQPMLEYGAAVAHLDPQPTAGQLLAAATFLSGSAVAGLSFWLRGTKKEEYDDPYNQKLGDPDGDSAGA